KLRNRGSSAADDVAVVAYFSEGIEPITVEGGLHELSPGTVTFKACKLSAGAEATYKIKARASAPGHRQLRVEAHCDSLGTKLTQERSTLFYAEDAVEVQ
ncbi:MAG TPA: hypothetical protein VHV77_07290, partial [Pirellulales bacterium]|nr:hypothetical protein [Pirellulales bacterium]